MNTPSTLTREQYREYLRNYLNLMEVEMMDDFDNLQLANISYEAVLGCIERETFDIKMALYEKNPAKTCREHFDLSKKVGNTYILCQVQVVGVA